MSGIRWQLRKPDRGVEMLVRLQRWPSLHARLIGKSVRIWSNEHEAFWRPNGAGYTTHEAEAGVYIFEDALRRTFHCGPEKRISFHLVDVPEFDGPIFIPLKRQFFEQFASGDKTHEYRVYGARWNAHTCKIGRSVVLSLGYGKQHRLHGVIVSFDLIADPLSIPGWRDCYGERDVMAADICIEVRRIAP